MPNYFGDSCTAALSAQDQPGRIYYPWWVSFLTGGPLPTVYAMATHGIADQAAFAYNNPKDDSFLLLGINDRLSYPPGGPIDPNGVALFKNSVAAVSYWITGDMVSARSPGWSYTGTWVDYVTGHPWAGKGRYSNVAGSVASTSIDGDVILIGYTMADNGITGTATVKVDGVALPNLLNTTPPRVIKLSDGHSLYAPGVYRAAGFGSGPHTVEIIPTTTGKYVMIDWAGGKSLATTRKMRLLTNPYTANAGDSVGVDAYNGALDQVELGCGVDGFDVSVIDTGSVVRLNEMCSNSAPGTNNYHPANHGQMNIGAKIVSEL